MHKRKGSKLRNGIICAAIGVPGLTAFMANVSAKEAVSNLASWFELAGLPVPEILCRPNVDEQVTQSVAAFYGLLLTLASLAVVHPLEPRAEFMRRRPASLA